MDPATGKSRVLISAKRLRQMRPAAAGMKDDRDKDNRARYGVADYHWAPGGKAILFDADGRLWLFPLDGSAAQALTGEGLQASDPVFSPDGKQLSFVRGHNLYVQTIGGELKALTADGGGNLFNGEVDWLYAEELDVRSNQRWSPDSTQLLFLQSDESPVPTYPIVDWMETHPGFEQIKYPKAGDANPVVRLGLTGLGGGTTWVKLSDEKDLYIPRFGWLRPGLAWALTLNRHQNVETLYLIDASNGASTRILAESDSRYIELRDSGVKFLTGSNRFLWPSWRDGHTHLYLYSFENKLDGAKLERQITSGDFEDGKIEAVDEKNALLYFTANAGDDRQSHLYSIRLDGTEMKQLTAARGSHNAELSADNSFYLDSYSSLLTPKVQQLCPVAAGAVCKELWRAKGLEGYATRQPQLVDFKAEDGTVLHGALLLPDGNAPGTVNGKHPLIMNPYGGPGSQDVTDAWHTMGTFDQLLAQQGFAVLKVDNRGMSGRGRKFATVTYGNLEETELRDQLAALDQALARYPQLDGKRLGWWGWSYGGTMTLYAMTHSTRFAAGVAVAPVTDWRLYDSTYTERYMNLPADNAAGYEKSSLVKAATQLHGRLTIVHGTSDDNVHMQNTLQFVDALIAAGKPYTLQLFPRRTHSISGRESRLALYGRILDDFESALEPGVKPVAKTK
jgi:dipeptidyl-peptidase-4